MILQKELTRMHSMRMIVGSSGQGTDSTASRKLSSGWSRGTTEREDLRIRSHRTAFSAEIRAAVGTPLTQRTVRNQLLQGQFLDRRPVACILLTPSLRGLRRQVRAHCSTEWRLAFKILEVTPAILM
ncbi:HTH_Tnp_Tc3_2 domain-containing protein [Trichonephila clavipes]|nr:HTH_Tnp_Tc3_2 domain-containing protein [Trichonephila clavipes]